MKTSIAIGALALAAVAGSGSRAMATVVIDAFSNKLPAETFYDASRVAFVSEGLEVGAIRLAPGVVTVRESESVTQTGLSGVFGGQRTATLTRTTPIGSTAFNRSASAAIDLDEWGSDTPSGTRTNALFQYGNVTALNADFSAFAVGGAFLLSGWTLDQGTVTGTVTVTSGATMSNFSITLTQAYSPADYTIPFSAFTGINWADVDVITLSLVNNTTGQDSGLQSFSVIPTPGAAAVLGLGGLLAARRRR
jgi:MYXO-CTERM domain-containing protein